MDWPLGGVHCLRELEQGADGFFTGCPHPAQLVDVMACMRRGDRAAAEAAHAALLPLARQERANPAAMAGLRKAILRDCGVLRDATVRVRGSARRCAVT